MEAPTGEGKTEAALALAHRIAQKTGCDELYYALPTTATSNQMWGRLKTHLQQRLALPGDVKLIHGQAFLLQDDLVVKPLADDDGEQEAMLEWFAPKKRSLLAPFGVGTVDQAELGALNVPYVTLRLVGLAGKVVIFDEVHAYDTYMTTVVERLLEWLAAVGTSVIILSATLPNSRRQALVRAFSGTELTAPDSDAYPCLWVVGPSHSHFAAPRAYQSNRTLELHVLNLAHGEPAAKAQWLLDTVATGGCACWLTNTVRRAQDIYAALRVMAPPGVDLTLIHSQFPLEDREAIETLIQERYGPGGARRPASGIVVGTQVLEQSLDLDFDVMVTDLAPVDLVLQRAGRLHRHQRNRPKAHDSPRLWLNVPEAEDGNPSLAGDRHVYDEFILHITWRMLRERSQINLPADYRALVEAVYAADPPGHDDPLARAWEELAKKQADARAQARIRLLPPPDPSSVFCPDAAALQFQEDEEGSGWIVAKTRLGEDTVNVIPLERHGHVAVVGQQQLDLRALPDRQTQFRLLRRSLRISHPAAVRALKEVSKDRPPCFKRAARLKGYQPLWLENGQAKLTWQGKTLVLTLDPALGLRVASASEGG
jgi:CRISPR-associated endonuclease/helicase Cas3